MASSKPRGFDAFCGAGGATRGYQNAGAYMVGCDTKPQPRYVGEEFIQGDALELLADLEFMAQFDFIHASPPCQLFSAYQRANKHQGEHLNLIPETRELLRATGLPYVIENVPGAPLLDPVMICGVSAGCGVRRHRLFESNVSLMTSACACGGWMPAIYPRGSRHIRPNDRRTVAVGEWRIPLKMQQEAMGIDWMTVPEMSQAIPPAYTELIGHQLMSHLKSEDGSMTQEAEARRLAGKPWIAEQIRWYYAEREGMDEESAVALLVVECDSLLAKAEQERDEARADHRKTSEAYWRERDQAKARERKLREALRQTRFRIATKTDRFKIMDEIDAALQATQEDGAA